MIKEGFHITELKESFIFLEFVINFNSSLILFADKPITTFTISDFAEQKSLEKSLKILGRYILQSSVLYVTF